MIHLKKVRKQLGINQTELAVAIGVTTPMISFYERGVNQLPVQAAKQIAAYAKTLGHAVSYEDIYGPIT